MKHEAPDTWTASVAPCDVGRLAYDIRVSSYVERALRALRNESLEYRKLTIHLVKGVVGH